MWSYLINIDENKIRTLKLHNVKYSPTEQSENNILSTL